MNLAILDVNNFIEISKHFLQMMQAKRGILQNRLQAEQQFTIKYFQ